QLHGARATRQGSDFGQRRSHSGEVIGVNALEAGTAHELGWGEPEQALGRLAGEQHRAIGGKERDRVGAVLDQCAEPLLALAASLLRSDLLAPRSAEVERPEDSGPEPLQMMLD